jgi:hypothetical protein
MLLGHSGVALAAKPTKGVDIAGVVPGLVTFVPRKKGCLAMGHLHRRAYAETRGAALPRRAPVLRRCPDARTGGEQ